MPPIDQDAPEEPAPQPTPPPHSSSHPMVTRSNTGIFKPLYIVDFSSISSSTLYQTLFTSKEPKGFKSTAKDPKRFAAMCHEMNALKLNVAWDLVHLVPRPIK